MKIILGSSSPSRKKLLKNTGIDFKVKSPTINETAQKKEFKGKKKDLAIYLAEKKALSIHAESEDIIIGADQVLLHNNKIYDKPRSIQDAKKHLKELSNKTHSLISGTVISKKNKIIWRHQSVSKMKMRKLANKEINEYLSQSGKNILKCVGAYNIEGYGSKLFKKIDGDFFSIVGLPLIQLLNAINKIGKIR